MISKCRFCDSDAVGLCPPELPYLKQYILQYQLLPKGERARCGFMLSDNFCSKSRLTLNYFHSIVFTSVEILETIQRCRTESKKQTRRLRALFPLAWVEKEQLRQKSTQWTHVLWTWWNPTVKDHCPLTFADFKGHLIPDLSKFATFTATYFMKSWDFKNIYKMKWEQLNEIISVIYHCAGHIDRCSIRY